MKVASCKCGCVETVKGKRVFMNKEHQLAWMLAGGAREMNALLPDEARAMGGHVAGTNAFKSGRLKEAADKGGAKSRKIAQQFRIKKANVE